MSYPEKYGIQNEKTLLENEDHKNIYTLSNNRHHDSARGL